MKIKRLLRKIVKKTSQLAEKMWSRRSVKPDPYSEEAKRSEAYAHYPLENIHAFVPGHLRVFRGEIPENLKVHDPRRGIPPGNWWALSVDHAYHFSGKNGIILWFDIPAKSPDEMRRYGALGFTGNNVPCFFAKPILRQLAEKNILRPRKKQ